MGMFDFVLGLVEFLFKVVYLIFCLLLGKIGCDVGVGYWLWVWDGIGVNGVVNLLE